MAKEKKGMMFVLSSPSGAGKTTLAKKIAENNKNFTISISHTTRKPRPNEINGKDYQFVSVQEFNTLVKENNFFEYANIFDNYYGTLKEPVLKFLSLGKDVLFDIDWQGARKVREKEPAATSIFILPPSRRALIERLQKRGEDSPDEIERRTSLAVEEISHFDEFDYVLVNDDFDKAVSELMNIIHSIRKGLFFPKSNLSDLATRLLSGKS